MIGPSGCGKTALSRLLAGFERPDAGAIELDGREIREPNRDVLMLFQEVALFPWMTTYENIMYGPEARREASRKTLEFAEHLIQKVGLQAFRDKYPSQLSGGMQRRAEIARAIINHPRVMILDEPFRGLDAMTKALMWTYYAELFEESTRSDLFITTEIDEAVVLADRLLVMTNIPTSVRAVVDIDLPRPRDLGDPRVRERLNDIKRQALELLHEEAWRSFGRQPGARQERAAPAPGVLPPLGGGARTRIADV